MKAKKRLIRKILGCLLAVLFLMGCAKSTEQQISEQLELGQKYLAEQNYEEALAAFNKILELDPKQWEAYKGKASVYETMGELQEAIDSLEEGVMAVGKENVPSDGIDMLVSFYQKLADTARKRGDLAVAESGYQGILEWNPDAQEARENLDLLQEAVSYEKPVQELVDSVVVENYDFDSNLLLTDEFKAFCEKLKEPVLFQTETEKFIAIYRDCYVYYGVMMDGKREDGNGLWFRYITCPQPANYIEFFSGCWKEDLPNGKGNYSIRYGNGDYILVEGSWEDGLENGEMKRLEYTTVFGWQRTFIYHTEKGIPSVLATKDHERKNLIISYAQETQISWLAYSSEQFPMGVRGLGVKVGSGVAGGRTQWRSYSSH